MRPLRYFINIALDGCCDHRAGIPEEELHRHAVENLRQADALLFGRVTYEMMEAEEIADCGLRARRLGSGMIHRLPEPFSQIQKSKICVNL